MAAGLHAVAVARPATQVGMAEAVGDKVGAPGDTAPAAHGPGVEGNGDDHAKAGGHVPADGVDHPETLGRAPVAPLGEDTPQVVAGPATVAVDRRRAAPSEGRPTSATRRAA